MNSVLDAGRVPLENVCASGVSSYGQVGFGSSPQPSSVVGAGVFEAAQPALNSSKIAANNIISRFIVFPELRGGRSHYLLVSNPLHIRSGDLRSISLLRFIRQYLLNKLE